MTDLLKQLLETSEASTFKAKYPELYQELRAAIKTFINREVEADLEDGDFDELEDDEEPNYDQMFAEIDESANELFAQNIEHYSVDLDKKVDEAGIDDDELSAVVKEITTSVIAEVRERISKSL